MYNSNGKSIRQKGASWTKFPRRAGQLLPHCALRPPRVPQAPRVPRHIRTPVGRSGGSAVEGWGFTQRPSPAAACTQDIRTEYVGQNFNGQQQRPARGRGVLLGRGAGPRAKKLSSSSPRARLRSPSAAACCCCSGSGGEQRASAGRCVGDGGARGPRGRAGRPPHHHVAVHHR